MGWRAPGQAVMGQCQGVSDSIQGEETRCIPGPLCLTVPSLALALPFVTDNLMLVLMGLHGPGVDGVMVLLRVH